MHVLSDRPIPIGGAQASTLALAQAVTAYLPELMVAMLVESVGQVGLDILTEPRCFDAATMMVDITGFTPLCEALARQGREGAEQVTGLINGFFTHALRLVQDQDGVIAKFGGDAFLAFFSRRDAEDWDIVLQRALNTAFALQSLVLEYEGLRLAVGAGDAAQIFRLSAKVGLSAGSILTFSVGIPSRHRDFQVAGAPFNEASEAEHHAGQGEIVIHQEFLSRAADLRQRLTLGAARGATWPVRAIAPGGPPSRSSLVDLSSLPAAVLDDVLARAVAFVPRPVYERLKLGYQGLPGEHRRVISLFVNVAGFAWIEDPAAPAHFHDYYLALLAEVETHNGHLNRISSGDKGDLLHIIFGAPVTHEDDEEQALRCALALQAVARRFPIVTAQRIGVSSGYVFAGEIGSSRRCEYTVMGDSVNLSARLMQLAAPWTIVLDAALAARLATRFEFTPLRPVRLKGKQDLIDICDVVGSRAAGSHGHAGLLSEPLLPIYGRDRELALAFATVDSALGGAARVLAVSGEPGIGKSVFLSHVAQRWHAAGGTVCHISVLHYERGAFTLWAKWLAELLQLDPGATPEQRAAHFTSTVAAIDPALAEWTPLWGELLDLDLPESPILRSLDRPSRYQRLADLTPLLLAGIARRQPLLLLGDDLHWADSASVELLDHVVPLLKDVPFLICVGFRPTEVTTFGLLSAQQCQTIPLQALADSASDALIRDALAGQAIAAEDQARFAAAVNELAGGNPFFIAELLSTLRAAGGLEAAIAGAGGSAPLSYNLQSLIMARLDTLDSRLREVVLAASVVGGQFSDDMIRPLLPASVAETLGYAAFSPLNQLHELDLLRPEIEPGAAVRARPTYRFRHALIQQVAYESLPFARRRLLHEEVGRHFEAHDHQSATADELLERLAYHYERSTNDQKAVLYLARSAERSARLFANTESLHQYQAALARAQQAAGRTTPNPAELLFELGNVQAQTADFPAALASYDQALLEIASADPFERPHLERRRAEVLVRATRFDEAQVAIERIERHLEQLAADAPRAVVNRSRLGQAQLAELRSTILMRQADFESASQWAEQGLKLLEGAVGRQPKSAITKIKLYQALAAPAAMLQRMDVAVHSISRALRLIQKQEDPVLEGQLQLRLAILAMQQDQLQRARPFFQRALPMIERTGARDRLAYTLLPGGETFLYRGEYQQAEQWIQRGLGLAEEVGTPFLICAAHSLLGWVQTVLGHWDSALDHFAQGTHLAQQHGLWDRYTEYLSRQGELLFYRGKIRDAEEMVLEAIKCAEDHALPRSIIVSQRVLAKIYYKQHRFDLAAPCLRQIMDKTDEDTALVLGEWWAKTTLSGQPVDSLLPVDEIQRRAEAALTFFQTRGFKLFVPTARRVNGLIAWAQNRPADAIRHFNRGLMLARASGHIPETVRLLVVRSQFKRASGASGGSATIRRDLSEAAALLRYLGAQPELDLVAQMLS